jgi:hypothetical protein
MLKESRVEGKYDVDLQTVIKSLQMKGYEEIRADLPDHELPLGFSGVDKDLAYAPDISATKYEAVSFFEISHKTPHVQMLVTKWKLLATVAGLKRGKLTIYMPKGTAKFTRELVERYKIQAELEKL